MTIPKYPHVLSLSVKPLLALLLPVVSVALLEISELASLQSQPPLSLDSPIKIMSRYFILYIMHVCCKVNLIH